MYSLRSCLQKLVAINPSNAAALNFVGYSWANDGINLQMALRWSGVVRVESSMRNKMSRFPRARSHRGGVPRG